MKSPNMVFNNAPASCRQCAGGPSIMESRASFGGATGTWARLSRKLGWHLLRVAGFCLVLAWVGCKTVSPYDQLEIQKKKNEEMELEREHKSWEINR